MRTLLCTLAILSCILFTGCDQVYRIKKADDAAIYRAFEQSVKEFYAANSLGRLIDTELKNDVMRAVYIFDLPLDDGRKLEVIELYIKDDEEAGVKILIDAYSPRAGASNQELDDVAEVIAGKMLRILDQ